MRINDDKNQNIFSIFFLREFVLHREFLGENSLRNFRCKFPLPAGIYPKFPLPAGIYKFPLGSGNFERAGTLHKFQLKKFAKNSVVLS